jgi:hypothetical protein
LIKPIFLFGAFRKSHFKKEKQQLLDPSNKKRFKEMEYIQRALFWIKVLGSWESMYQNHDLGVKFNSRILDFRFLDFQFLDFRILGFRI